MKTIIFSVKNSYFFSCLLENSVWSGNAKEYNFWIHTIFFLWDFPSMFYVIETMQRKKKCLGIPDQHLFCRSAWRSYRNQWLQSIYTPKGYPNSPHPCLCHLLFFITVYDSYPIPQQRNFFPLLSSVKEISK